MSKAPRLSETERLIEKINEVYDEEIVREDKEFAQRTKGYYRRLFSIEEDFGGVDE